MYATLTLLSAILGGLALIAISGALIALAKGSGRKGRAREWLVKWTILDYILLLLAACSVTFLAVDFMAAMRDREAYPFYHLGFLATGFVFTCLTFLFLFVRLGLALSVRACASGKPADHHQNEPSQTDKPEQRI